jgi:DNA-directed RNA polymerase subunit RPC12/RpoP
MDLEKRFNLRPMGSVGTKQKRPVAGIIFMGITLVPLVCAALFGVFLPCYDDFGSYCESNNPMWVLFAGGVATLGALILVRRKFYPEIYAEQQQMNRDVGEWLDDLGMKDIQVDEDGNLRCATCGGKHFQGRRTTRAHVIGFVTLGAGALLTQKKLRCLQCGAYNYQGGMGTKAQRWNDPEAVGGGEGEGEGEKILPTEPQYVRVTENGDFRCWHCGFTELVAPPNAADMTPKQLRKAGKEAQSPAKASLWRCKRCGHPNEMSATRPWEGPVSKKNWGEPVSKKNAEQTDPSNKETPPSDSDRDKVARLKDLTELRDAGAINEAEFAALKAEILST